LLSKAIAAVLTLPDQDQVSNTEINDNLTEIADNALRKVAPRSNWPFSAIDLILSFISVFGIRNVFSEGDFSRSGSHLYFARQNAQLPMISTTNGGGDISHGFARSRLREGAEQVVLFRIGGHGHHGTPGRAWRR
jgi:hypothetical protein